MAANPIDAGMKAERYRTMLLARREKESKLVSVDVARRAFREIAHILARVAEKNPAIIPDWNNALADAQVVVDRAFVDNPEELYNDRHGRQEGTAA